jgi:CheY-like chemotaxis protein
MDGLQASRHIKSDETLSRQPAIVLVTAFGREEVREEAERLQLDGFLVKPVTKSMIVDTLVNVFAEPGEHAGVAAESEHAARLRGARILVTEDNEINQQIATELLEGAGAIITVANNGREAVEILSNDPRSPSFDVVMMDLQMPEMDGYQATAKIRSDARFATLPIIAMTAHATIEERQRCLAAGMNDHVSKPIDPANLFETVARFYKPAEPPTTARPGATTGHGRTPGANDLPLITGLDAMSGLSRVGGNQKLYLKLLRQFVEEQGTAVEQIRDALSNGRRELAERLAHTLKGVAGNIGATRVQAAAGGLEKLIRDRGSEQDVASAARRLADDLDPLTADLRAALGAMASQLRPSAPATRADPVQSREAAAKLALLLSESDPGAADFVETNQAALRPLFGGGTWPEFEKLVDDYEFADAHALLQRALRESSA